MKAYQCARTGLSYLTCEPGKGKHLLSALLALLLSSLTRCTSSRDHLLCEGSLLGLDSSINLSSHSIIFLLFFSHPTYLIHKFDKMGFGARFLYKIVRNESMKTDPPEIYGWRVFALACSACFGGMLFGMDIGIIGGVLTLPAFKAYVVALIM